MALVDDIIALPNAVTEGQSGHRTYHGTIHQGLKNHESRLSAEEARAYSWSQITGKPSTFAPSAHSHVIADITSLQTTLDGKANTSHTHSIANVTSLQATLDAKALDSAAVHKTGNEVVDGVKTFTTSPRLTTSTNQHRHAAYVSLCA